MRLAGRGASHRLHSLESGRMGHARLLLYAFVWKLCTDLHSNFTLPVPIILRVFVAILWAGMQAFWGGQATRVMFGAMIPGSGSQLAFLCNLSEKTEC